jgi:hypothetical protein
MVPGVYDAYLAAMATAAAALIGLFVAVSVRDDTIFGPNAIPGGEALAITAFTGLVNSFVVSLLQRAWSLLKGKHLASARGTAVTGDHDPPHGSDPARLSGHGVVINSHALLFFPALSIVAAIPADREPLSEWSAWSEARTNELDGRRQLILPAGSHKGAARRRPARSRNVTSCEVAAFLIRLIEPEGAAVMP